MPAIEPHPAIGITGVVHDDQIDPARLFALRRYTCPAPAPMIGRPAAILAANRSKMFDRVCIIADFSLSRIICRGLIRQRLDPIAFDVCTAGRDHTERSA